MNKHAQSPQRVNGRFRAHTFATSEVISGYILANASSAWSDSKSDSRFDGYCLISLSFESDLPETVPRHLSGGLQEWAARFRKKRLQSPSSLGRMSRARS